MNSNNKFESNQLIYKLKELFILNYKWFDVILNKVKK